MAGGPVTVRPRRRTPCSRTLAASKPAPRPPCAGPHAGAALGRRAACRGRDTVSALRHPTHRGPTSPAPRRSAYTARIRGPAWRRGIEGLRRSQVPAEGSAVLMDQTVSSRQPRGAAAPALTLTCRHPVPAAAASGGRWAPPSIPPPLPAPDVGWPSGPLVALIASPPCTFRGHQDGLLALCALSGGDASHDSIASFTRCPTRWRGCQDPWPPVRAPVAAPDGARAAPAPWPCCMPGPEGPPPGPRASTAAAPATWPCSSTLGCGYGDTVPDVSPTVARTAGVSGSPTSRGRLAGVGLTPRSAARPPRRVGAEGAVASAASCPTLPDCPARGASCTSALCRPSANATRALRQRTQTNTALPNGFPLIRHDLLLTRHATLARLLQLRHLRRQLGVLVPRLLQFHVHLGVGSTQIVVLLQQLPMFAPFLRSNMDRIG